MTLAGVSATLAEVAGLRAEAFLATFALDVASLRVGLANGFFVDLALPVARPVTLTAFFAGAFAAVAFLAIAFGLADLVLSVLLLVTGLEVERLVAGLLIPFVTGLLMRNTLKGQGLKSKSIQKTERSLTYVYR